MRSLVLKIFSGAPEVESTPFAGPDCCDRFSLLESAQILGTDDTNHDYHCLNCFRKSKLHCEARVVPNLAGMRWVEVLDP